jgi:hypothetical protein
MNTMKTELAEKVDELLLVLYKDIEHIERSIDELDELRELVIRRDDASLKGLLEQIRLRSQEYVENQKRREQLRRQIAEIISLPVGQVKLGRLQQIVPVERRTDMSQVRKRLRVMVSKLQSEYTGTVMLLADLKRFNGMLLNTIMEAGRVCNVTYDSRGGTSREGDVAFMNLRF